MDNATTTSEVILVNAGLKTVLPEVGEDLIATVFELDEPEVASEPVNPGIRAEVVIHPELQLSGLEAL